MWLEEDFFYFTFLFLDKKSTSPSSSPNTNVTASAMLKSTLKRMTKLTTSPVSRSSSFKEPQDITKHRNGSNSLKQPLMARSNSLRKVKNKDKTQEQMTNGSTYSLSRSGTSGKILLEAIGCQKSIVTLLFPIDTLSDLPQISCAYALIVWLMPMWI